LELREIPSKLTTSTKKPAEAVKYN